MVLKRNACSRPWTNLYISNYYVKINVEYREAVERKNINVIKTMKVQRNASPIIQSDAKRSDDDRSSVKMISIRQIHCLKNDRNIKRQQ